MVPMQSVGRRDSEDQFSAELARLFPTLKSFARSLTRNEDAAADLTQDTLMKAWQARNAFVQGTNLRAWLFTIMRNHFHSQMRRAWRQMPWVEEVFERLPGPSDEQTWSIELGDAVRAISSLSRCQREALILSGIGGFSGNAVGSIAHCGRAAAKSRVCRARHAVQSMLDGTEPLKTGRKKPSHDSIDDLLHELQTLAGSTITPAEACHS